MVSKGGGSGHLVASCDRKDRPCCARPADAVLGRGGPARRTASATGMGPRIQSRSREPQLCDDPHTGLSPRPDGDSRNGEEQGRPQSVKRGRCGHHRSDHRRHHHWPAGQVLRAGNRDNIPFWLTIVCGIGGVLIGYYLAAALGVAATRGIDWTRWIISIVVAAVLVMIAASVTGRRGRAV